MGLPNGFLNMIEPQADKGFATLPLGKNGLADERPDYITDNFDFSATEPEENVPAMEGVEVAIISGSSAMQEPADTLVDWYLDSIAAPSDQDLATLADQFPESEVDFAWTLINSTHAPEVDADPGWSWTGV